MVPAKHIMLVPSEHIRAVPVAPKDTMTTRQMAPVDLLEPSDFTFDLVSIPVGCPASQWFDHTREKRGQRTQVEPLHASRQPLWQEAHCKEAQGYGQLWWHSAPLPHFMRRS